MSNVDKNKIYISKITCTQKSHWFVCMHVQIIHNVYIQILKKQDKLVYMYYKWIGMTIDSNSTPYQTLNKK